ncbi:M56 family metallopeptidase [Phocaeicola coprophilus]|uniref:M56 family metallopeptidase n=1 Tax=Phocaeicola coprophilus TaxID=387090 RepID=UPI002943EC17|nr:M56 family metallopeptidase [Phocaeicola coprophilus]
MGTFLVYILKSAACLAVFYLFYKLLMSRDTFHRFNRFALLGVLVLSSLLPLVEASVNSPAAVQETMLTLEQLLLLADIQPEGESMAAATPSATVLWLRAALLVYLTGIVFFIVRNLCSLARLGRLIRQGKREALDSYLPDRKEKNVRLVVHDHDIAPFSWMHWIVIARKDLEENGREILIHELAHIRNRHSWDLLLADLCIFVQWFNPAAWLLKQELQNIHEYEADETVLREGVNARNYQMLLIKKAVGTRLYSMANSFNHSSLKKRITMMLKEKSNPWARAKYLYILPLAALAVTAFARPEVSAVADEISAVKVIAPAVHDSIQPNVQPAVAAPSSALDQMPEFPGGMEALNTYLRNNIRYPQEAQKAGIQGRVIIQFIVSKDGSITDAEVVESVDPQLDAEGLRLIKNMPRWKPGMRKGQAIRVKQTLPIRFAFTKTSDKPENSNSIFLKNGSYNSSLKDVILLVNEQEVSPEIFRAIDPQRIQSVTVLKDQASLAKYTTDKSKTGIIQVKLKKEDQASDINIPTIRFDSQTSKSLVIIDGKAADATAVQALSPSQIKSIKVLKGQQAVDLFGEAAKNGAICVSTRSAESETDK